MKKLILINGQGQEYDLLKIDKSPTFQVDGFGYVDSTPFMQIGSNFHPLEETIAQGAINLKILLWKNADKDYKEFVSHCRHVPLTMLYGDTVGEFYYPCKLKSIGKTEKVGVNIRGASVEFALTGNPYKIISVYNDGVSVDGKKYSFTYPCVYANDMRNIVRIQSDSYLHSPVRLTIYGNTVNPIWRHYCNGNLVETGAYAGTIPAGNRLVIDAKAVPFSIVEYDYADNVVADRYGKCDYSTERFMHAYEGVNQYVIAQDSFEAVRLKVEAYIEYETV